MSSPEQALAERVTELMMRHDAFSRWLGLEIVEIAPRYCVARMTVREEMVNGFGVSHGGIVFSFADSAFAFACNTHGRLTMSIENSITYPAALRPGDVITATAAEESSSSRLSFYRVVVTKGDGSVAALFRGTAYKTSREHFPTPATLDHA